MDTYDRLFSGYHHTVAQILLTGSDIKNEQRRKNFHNTLFRLLELGVLPVINENDTIATEETVSYTHLELEFADGKNDMAEQTNQIENFITQGKDCLLYTSSSSIISPPTTGIIPANAESSFSANSGNEAIVR